MMFPFPLLPMMGEFLKGRAVPCVSVSLTPGTDLGIWWALSQCILPSPLPQPHCLTQGVLSVETNSELRQWGCPEALVIRDEESFPPF